MSLSLAYLICNGRYLGSFGGLYRLKPGLQTLISQHYASALGVPASAGEARIEAP
jgi:hypothetical protein